jgi:hypothetical protein
MESGGGSVTVPRDHVRFSIWVDDQAVGAVSIPNQEAERLVEFLQSWLPAVAGIPSREAETRFEPDTSRS